MTPSQRSSVVPEPAGPGGHSHRERGSAAVDFALVGGLLTVLFLTVLQLGLALYTRNVLIDCAGEGARYGATADQDAAAAAERTRTLIRQDLADRFAGDVSARVVQQDGVQELEVQVEAPLPVLGLLGFGRTVHVTGHALVEGPERA